MKKLLLMLLVMCFTLPSALAGFGEFPSHYTASVVDSEKAVAGYGAFQAAGELSIMIPGLTQDFVPQGIAYYAPQNVMIFSGYSSAKASSMLLAVDMSMNGVVKEILLAMPDGMPYTGHAGGVCITDKNIFISNQGNLYRLPLSDYLNAAPMDVLAFAEAIPVPCKSSFCQISNGILWVGEFSYDKSEDHKSDKNHHVNVQDGTNNSWILGYELSDTDFEINPAGVPDYIISITDRIQGVTFNDNMIYLSQSYGQSNPSTIYRHTNVLADAPDMYVEVLGAQRPLWILDGSTETGRLTCPPMTEGLCTDGDSVYVAFESAAKQYLHDDKASPDPVDRLFKLTGF